MPLTEYERKFLTEEVLGECWHTDIATEGGRCPICDIGLAIPMGAGRALMPWNRHTFTTPDDFFALRNALVRGGEWEVFDDYAFNTWDDQYPDSPIRTYTMYLTDIDPDGVLRLARLVLEWKGRKQRNTERYWKSRTTASSRMG